MANMSKDETRRMSEHAVRKTKPKTLARRVMDLEVDLTVAYAHIQELQRANATSSIADFMAVLADAIGALPTKPALHKIRSRLHALETETAAHVIVMKELQKRIDIAHASAADAHARLDKHGSPTTVKRHDAEIASLIARVSNLVALVNDIENKRARRKSRPKPKARKKRSRGAR